MTMTIVGMSHKIGRKVSLMKLEEYFKISEDGTRFMTIREKVEEYARDLRINILDIKENVDITTELPEQCGVYIITTMSGKYIGSTINMKQRIRGHQLRRRIKTVDVYITEEMDDATIIEDLLIYCVRPELNKLIPNVENINMSKSREYQKRREEINAKERKYRKKLREKKRKKMVYQTLFQYLQD